MISYDQVQALLDRKDLAGLKELLNKSDLHSLLTVMHDLEARGRAVTFRLLNKELALEVFESLDVELQEELVTSFAENEVIALFSELEPDDRVRLIEELPARVIKKLLNSLSREERVKTAELMGYAPETAGRIMTPEYVRFRQGDTVADALKKIRQMDEEKETLYTLYVTDNERHLIGGVSLLSIVISQPDLKIEQLMNPNPVRVSTSTDQEEVAQILHQNDLLTVPVVDGENRLVGVVTFDDAIDVIEEETTEDIFGKAGLNILLEQEAVRSSTLISGSIWKSWRIRLPFLLIVLAGSVLAGMVIARYEETLAAITAIAFFIPIIMDTGGNVGVQSATIFVRALTLKQINIKRFFKHLIREIGVGLGIGLAIGSIAGVTAAIWQQMPALGLVVGLAIIATTTLASALGFIIPYLLIKLGLDQAAGSDPIIITIKGITGLLIYFFLASQFLQYLT